MMFIKLTNEALVTSPALVRVDKIKYVIETDDVSTIWLDNDETLDVRESVSDIQMIILEEIQRMERMKQ